MNSIEAELTLSPREKVMINYGVINAIKELGVNFNESCFKSLVMELEKKYQRVSLISLKR